MTRWETKPRRLCDEILGRLRALTSDLAPGFKVVPVPIIKNKNLLYGNFVSRNFSNIPKEKKNIFFYKEFYLRFIKIKKI